jgi:membrane protein required for colicin V production
VLVASVVSALMSRLVQATGLGGVDRSLGLMFGLVRGVIVVLILVALAGLTELPQQEFWRNALLRPYAVEGVHLMKPLLPEPLAVYVRV